MLKEIQKLRIEIMKKKLKPIIEDVKKHNRNLVKEIKRIEVEPEYLTEFLNGLTVKVWIGTLEKWISKSTEIRDHHKAMGGRIVRWNKQLSVMKKYLSKLKSEAGIR